MSSTVLITGLKEVTQDQVRDACGALGTIVDISVLPCKTRAMVTYSGTAEAEAAVKQLKGSTIEGVKADADLLLPAAAISKKETSSDDLLGLFQKLNPAQKVAMLTEFQVSCMGIGSGSDDKAKTSSVGDSKGTASMNDNGSNLQSHNFTQLPMMFAKTHIEPPRLPVFSGDAKEGSYPQWRYEVGCLETSATYPESVLLQAVRRSVRGKAAEVLLNLGDHLSVANILTKFDARFGEVLSMEQLLAKFYEAVQGEKESVTLWGCRLEDLITRARVGGKLSVDMSEHMLRTKFCSGLRSESLKSVVRLKVEQGVNFDSLLVYARTIEQEMGLEVKESDVKKGKAVQQNVQQVNTSGHGSIESKLDEILKQMRSLDGRVQKVERWHDEQSKQCRFQKEDRFRQSAVNDRNSSGDKQAQTGREGQQKKTKGQHQGGRKETRRCYKCKQVGHLSYDCVESEN